MPERVRHYFKQDYSKPATKIDRAGPCECLGCGATFKSWDKTRNRSCPACTRDPNRIEDARIPRSKTRATP